MPTRPGLFARALLIGTLLALFTRTYLLQPFRVPSDSMTPGLLPGDHVLVNRFLYGGGASAWLPAAHSAMPTREPQRFDVVVFAGSDGQWLIKRCLGLPGERVEVRDGKVLIDGKAVESVAPHLAPSDPATASALPTSFGPLRLGEDEYLVLGDHRAVSIDSRSFGPIHRRQILGRAFFIYWSIPYKIPGNEGSRSRGARLDRCFRPVR